MDASVRSAVYLAAVMYGGYDGYNAVRAKYAAATTQQEQRRCIAALGMSPYADLVMSTLEFCMSAAVRSQDTTYCIGEVTRNVHGRRIAWSYFRENYDELKRRCVSVGVSWLWCGVS